MNYMIVGEFVDTMANIEYGILIAVVLDAILLYVIASINSKKKLNVLSYIIAMVLLLPLTFQMSRLVFACQNFDISLVISDCGWFIFRRILWSVVFIVITGFCIYMTMDKKRSRGQGVPSGIQTGRRYNSNTSRRHR